MNRPASAPKRTIPSRWVESHCYLLNPGIFDTIQSFEDPQPCPLSYSPNGKLADRLKADGIEVAEVAADLSLGMHIQRRHGKGGGNVYYRLTGVRYEVFANPATGKNTGTPMAQVSSVRPLHKLSRSGKGLTAVVSFVPVWDEMTCDLDNWFRGCQALNIAEGLLKKAADDLASPRGQVELASDAGAHAAVRLNYGALQTLIELLEQKSRNEQAATATGVVLSEGNDPGDAPGEAVYLENGSGAPALAVRVDEASGVFEDNQPVLIRSIKNRKEARTRLAEIDEKTYYLDPVDDPVAQIGDRVQIERIPRFAMKAHSISLNRFMREEIEGNWPDLAAMLCDPGKLPAPSFNLLPRFLCESDKDPKQLNDKQKRAVSGAVGTRNAFFIQGPPGTGKTTVITEIVRQLAQRGERVLLLAPTHVAVDEVLCRVADHYEVYPLRLSWDDTRIRKNLRCFTLAEMRREFAEKVLNAPAVNRRGLMNMADTLSDRLSAARVSVAARGNLDQARSAVDQKRRRLEQYRRDHTEALGKAEGSWSAVRKRLGNAELAYRKAGAELDAIGKQYEAVIKRQTGFSKLFNALGFGKAVKLRRQLARARADLDQCGGTLEALKEKAGKAAAAVAAMQQERPIRENTLTNEIESAVQAQEKANRERIASESALAAAFGTTAEKAISSLGDVRRQHEKVTAYLELLDRWQELTGFGSNRSNDTVAALARQIGDDLLQSANLICCTTAGVAGAKFIHETDFDTLIIDEASRVTDGEFLIGAVRARRWILVGDENQLPPYVDQGDEHFLHALAALHKRDRNASASLESVVDELSALWQEDEELHRFREASVTAVAEDIIRTGQWRQTYKAPFEQAYRFLPGNGNAEKALLDTMRRYMVRSLFERAVKSASPNLRQPLTQQRRMLPAIADIVSMPIYGGKYDSAPEDELAARGVTPLLTPTFGRPITFLDTGSHGRRAADLLVGSGFVNDLEAQWIEAACLDYEWHLRQRDESPIDVSILCFYRAQAREIRRRLGHPSYRKFSKLKFHVIDAIDKIQGQESDLVFISFCRAHTAGRPGPRFGQWLQDLRRLNVACTRARRALVFVGHRPTLSKLSSFPEAVDFYRHLFTLFKTRRNAMRMINNFKGANQ